MARVARVGWLRGRQAKTICASGWRGQITRRPREYHTEPHSLGTDNAEDLEEEEKIPREKYWKKVGEIHSKNKKHF